MKIEHYEKSAWVDKNPTWTMSVMSIVVINLWGGNYGTASVGIYREYGSGYTWKITDYQHGCYKRDRLEHLDGFHVSEIARKFSSILHKEIISDTKKEVHLE
jgi:hypothetical protein